MTDLDRRLRVLLALVVATGLLWFVLVAVGLTTDSYADAPTGLVLAGYVVVVVLSLAILVLRTPCACKVPQDRLPLPSAEGLAVGALTYALGAIILGAIALPGIDVPAELATVLLWLVGVLFGVLALVAMIAGLLACRDRHEDESPRPDEETVPVPDDAWLLPDPWLYSQEWARAVGAEVTWDNPSVTLYDKSTNVETPPNDLDPGADYGIFVEIRNGSSSMPAPVSAVGTEMTIRLRQFGIGGGTVDWVVPPSSAITVPDIPKTPQNPGDPAAVQVVSHDWTAPTDPDHYCMIFELHHPDDANTLNNEGQHNLDVGEAAPGETMTATIPLWNRQPDEEDVEGTDRLMGMRRTTSLASAGGFNQARMSLMTRVASPLLWVWSLPFRFLQSRRTRDQTGTKPTPEEPEDGRQLALAVEDGDPKREIDPSGWDHALDEQTVTLDPVEHDRPTSPGATVSLDVDVPATAEPGDLAVFNVTATRQGALVGGVTVLTRVVEP